MQHRCFIKFSFDYFIIIITLNSSSPKYELVNDRNLFTACLEKKDAYAGLSDAIYLFNTMV